MATTHPGTAYLNARAVLEHPRIKHHDDETFITFDGILRCASPARQNQVICSFSYKKKHENEQIHVSIYDIHAKVVSFRPQTHDASPARRDNQFDLMGDIFDLFRVSATTALFAIRHTPARLSISGKVSATQQDIGTFTMSVQQTIRWAAPNTTLNIRGAIRMRATWPPTVDQHLPILNSVISFSGQLVAFDHSVALIALDDLCYLPRPGNFV